MNNSKLGENVEERFFLTISIVLSMTGRTLLLPFFLKLMCQDWMIRI